MNDLLTRIRDWAAGHLSAKTASVFVIALLILAFWGGGHYQDWLTHDNGLTLVRADADVSAVQASSAEEDQSADSSGSVTVHVTGAVNAPGVYTLPEGKRIDDAVRAAGVRAEADLDRLNLAQKLKDGQKIVVPVQGQADQPASASSGDGTAASGAQVNINSATKEELMTLPSIGEVRAEAIIKYREENGGFQAPEDLQKVSGIGQKTYADLESRIMV